MALGSGVGRAIRVALRPGLIWVLCGVVVGTAAALGFERFLKSFLWGVQPGDPLTLAGVGIGIAAGDGAGEPGPGIADCTAESGGYAAE